MGIEKNGGDLEGRSGHRKGRNKQHTRIDEWIERENCLLSFDTDDFTRREDDYEQEGEVL